MGKGGGGVGRKEVVGMEEGVGREGEICVIGFRGMDATDLSIHTPHHVCVMFLGTASAIELSVVIALLSSFYQNCGMPHCITNLLLAYCSRRFVADINRC